MIELTEYKQDARATWAAGNYPAIAQLEVWPVGERIVDRMGVAPGERVLDVACGTGNAALRAAQRGARVVGVDLTPELLDAGRELAADAGVAVDWREGDAEALPCADAGFDVVLSTFGCMFAPRHHVVARELARVLAPGGRLGVCSWTPEGTVGRFFTTIASYLPPLPSFASTPVLWGSEDHVRGLFAGTGIELEVERELLEPPADGDGTVEEAIEFVSTAFGPLMRARAHTEAAGTWPMLHEDLAALFASEEPAEYLVAVGRRPL